MLETLLEVLPLAIAIAASPLTIIPAIVLLLTPRPRATASAYALGWFLGLIVVLTATAALAGAREAGDGTSPTWLAWLRIVVGVLLLALAIRSWVGRRSPKPMPAWMRALTTATPARALGLGVVLSVANPKVLLLAATAGLGIGASGLSRSEVLVAVLVMTVASSLTVLAPLLLYLARGDAMTPTLKRAGAWLERNNAVIMAVVFVALGITVLLEGIAGLT